ncbi:MAG TPA: hypothetical protein VJ488_03210 [Dehalococcoidia bacterium]|nr:hypothetical protein [Dehalococcoidia bacterium]
MTMGIWSDKIKELKNLPNPYALLYSTAKVLGGVGIGVLLANWLPMWTWWIFIVIACVIAIPIIWKLLRK